MSVSLLYIGTRGLAVNQGSLATTAHNIANANTPGYSRQEAVLSTAAGLYSGAGFFGRGADITTVRRSYDQFLTQAVRTTGSAAGADRARSEALGQLDGMFADPSLGIGVALDNVFFAAGDMANRPTDMAARQAFLARVDQMAQRFSHLAGQLQDLLGQVNSRLTHEAGQANDRLTEIRQLNTQISQLQSAGQPPNDLLDKRDQALAGLSKLMGVRVVAADDGGVNLFTPAGVPLLVGQQQATLSTAPDLADPSRLTLQARVGGAPAQPLDATALGGGSMAGTLRFRDEDLASAGHRLDALATAITDQLNARQALGVDSTGAPGQPLLARPASGGPGLASVAGGLRPMALAPSQLATGYAAMPEAGAGNTGSARVMSFAVTRPGPENTTDVTITFTGPNTFRVTGLPPGSPTEYSYVPGGAIPAKPEDFNGWRMVLDGAPATGDSFLVRRTASPGADNRNALAFGQIANLRLIDGSTLNQAYAGMLADVGTRVQSARDLAGVSERMEVEAMNRKEAVSGVNFDEEAANMLRYQQSYQACAKVIQAGQSLFDSLLAATGR